MSLAQRSFRLLKEKTLLLNTTFRYFSIDIEKFKDKETAEEVSLSPLAAVLTQ